MRARAAFCLLMILVWDGSWARSEQLPPPLPSAPASHSSQPSAPPASTESPADRDFDLSHVALDLTLDETHRALRGAVVNSLTPLRDRLQKITLQCGENLVVTSCAIDGKESAFRHEGDGLDVFAASALTRGKPISVRVRYVGKDERSGFHWIRPTRTRPLHRGFWTVGVPARNHRWIPTWDYPNDFATSEMRITAPLDWDVISNGELVSNKVDADARTHTVHWKMDQPHATYLNSVVGGPFDIKTATWNGVSLLYVVPRGKAHLIDNSFGDTPDMLDFFSKILRTNYPWRKYAQCAVYDYTSGIENVSVTTLRADDLMDSRAGFRNLVDVTSHELAHQWFGDLVTCKDWGHLWLNEGFATFLRNLYLEHSRGRYEYDHIVGDTARRYFAEAREYKRPLATSVYSKPTDMFDQHAYSKGAMVLHMLRRSLGDRAFFDGLHHYLTKHRYKPVESRDLCVALSESTGIDLAPFFDQWVLKPGHPVLDYTWEWADSAREVILKVKQEQSLADGTPVYDLKATIGLITGSELTRVPVRIDRVSQEIRIAQPARPSAVLLDPDHDLLREIPTLHWSAQELPFVLRYAPNAEDREEAMRQMLLGSPSKATVQMVAEAIAADGALSPAFRSLDGLDDLKDEDLRPLFRAQIAHPNVSRRVQAIQALGRLSRQPQDVQALRELVNDRQPYAVIRASVSTLAAWDAPHNRDIFQIALRDYSQHEDIRLRALEALRKAAREEGKRVIDPNPPLTQKLASVLAAVAQGVDSPFMTQEMKDDLRTNEDDDEREIIQHLNAKIYFVDSILAETSDPDPGQSETTQIRYYTAETPLGPCFLRFSLTADEKVADVNVESDN